MLTHLEFLGMPGSGKTTVYRALYSKLHHAGRTPVYTLDEAVYQGMKYSRQTRYLRWAARMFPYHIGYRLIGRFPKTKDDVLYIAFRTFVRQHPELAGIIQQYQRECVHETQDLGLLAFLWMFELCAKYQFAVDELREDAMLLLDEGFSQRVISLFAYQDQGELEAKIACYLESIPLPDSVIVLINTSESVNVRMQNRGYPFRVQTMAAEEIIAFLERTQRCIDITAEYLQRKGVSLYHIDNTGSQMELEQHIQHLVKSL